MGKMFYNVGVGDGNPLWYDTHDGQLDSSFEYPCWELMPPDAEIMQYTGLKDKNGREIYEGDVVKWLGYEVYRGKQIRPERKRAIGCNLDPQRNTFLDDCFHLQNILERGGCDIEVIGNVHENQELLK